MLKSFNNYTGWQRLWLVLSVVYFFVVVFFTIIFLPGQSEYSTKRVYDTIKLMIKNEPKLSKSSAYKVRAYYKDMQDDRLVEAIHKKYSGKIDFSSIEHEYQKKISSLHYERVQIFILGFSVWIVPVFIIYVLGLSTAWIIKGFKKPDKNL